MKGRKFLFLVGFLWVSMNVWGQQSFGYLSYSEVLQSMPQYSEAQERLNTLKTEYMKETERAEQIFSKQFAEYIDGQKSFSENIMMKRQKELQQLMDQSIEFKKEAEDLLRKAEKELMEPVETRLKDAIRAVGTELNLDYILNTDGNMYPFINEEKGVNVTDKVKGML